MNNKIIVLMSMEREQENEYIVSGAEANAIRTILDSMTERLPISRNQKVL